MISIVRLQDYLRQNAKKQYELVSLPPFSLFFHRTDPLIYYNYAIPNEPLCEVMHTEFAGLLAEFARRGRQPRFEFIEEFAPDLAASLRTHHFVEEVRQQGMLCMPNQVRLLAPVPELTIHPITDTSPVVDAKTFMSVQRRGFEEQDGQEASEQEAQQFLDGLHGGKAFLAQWHGQPVGVGMYSAHMDGLTELVGVATLPAFRRRGIGTAIVSEALRSAFAEGVEAVYLTAADEQAGRIYAQVGFRAYTTMLAYCDRS